LQTLEKSPFFIFVQNETINNLYGNSEVEDFAMKDRRRQFTSTAASTT
jgi:hypothetical protein